MLTSMLKTLACKYDSTVPKMAAKYMTTVPTPHGPRRCFQASVPREAGTPLVARFGGIPLRRQNNTVLTDRAPLPTTGPKELISRLLTGRCEICDQPGEVQVHHVGKLADLGKPGEPPSGWRQLMANRRRKTLVVCQTCHDSIHPGQPTATLTP
jgi:hypothetical protein